MQKAFDILSKEITSLRNYELGGDQLKQEQESIEFDFG